MVWPIGLPVCSRCRQTRHALFQSFQAVPWTIFMFIYDVSTSKYKEYFMMSRLASAEEHHAPTTEETISDQTEKIPEDCTDFYKQYEDGFIVRSMMASDIKYPTDWFNGIGPSGRDLELAFQASSPDPVGYFIGEFNGEVVASAIRIEVAEGVFYGSMFYVAEAYRCAGFGRRIRDEVAVKVVGDNSLTIDAHLHLEAMNVRRGYVPSHKVISYMGTANPANRKHSNANVLDASQVPFEQVLAYDDQCYIRPRSSWRRKYLRSFFDLPGVRAVVALGATGVVGLACRQPTNRDGYHIIGPLYADKPEIAMDLVTALTVDCTGDQILISVSENNPDAVELVNSLGMKDRLHLLRMYLNGHPGNQSNKVFAVTSIDVCAF